MLAPATATASLRLWDVPSGRVRRTLPGGHGPHLHRCLRARTERFIAVGDGATAAPVGRPPAARDARPLGDHRRAGLPRRVQPRWIAARGRRRAAATVRLWDRRLGELRHQLTGHGRDRLRAGVPPGSSPARQRRHRWRIRLWDPRAGRLLPRADRAAGRGVLGRLQPGRHRARELRQRRERAALGCRYRPARGTTLAGHRASVWPMVFRPDGGQLATSSNDGTVRLWDPVAGQCRHVFAGHGRRITGVRSARTVTCSPPAATTASCGCGSQDRPAGQGTDRHRRPAGLSTLQPGRRAARHGEQRRRRVLLECRGPVPTNAR